MISPLKQDLIDLTRRIAIKRGTFKLAGGGTSDFYIDMRLITLHPQGAFTTGRLVFDIAVSVEPGLRAVAGPAVSGIPIASAVTVVSLQKNSPLFSLIVRSQAKDHGTMSLVEGMDNIPAPATIVLVDDVLTSGSSLMKAVDQVREAGYKVSHAVVLLNRMANGVENLAKKGIHVHSCMDLKDLGVL